MRVFVIAGLMFATASAWAADPKTERLWTSKCGSCHGPDGKGQTEQGKKQQVTDISTAEWQAKFTDDQLKTAIENGVKETRGGVKKEMKAYKAELTPDKIASLVTFVRGLKK